VLFVAGTASSHRKLLGTTAVRHQRKRTGFGAAGFEETVSRPRVQGRSARARGGGGGRAALAVDDVPGGVVRRAEVVLAGHGVGVRVES